MKDCVLSTLLSKRNHFSGLMDVVEVPWRFPTVGWMEDEQTAVAAAYFRCRCSGYRDERNTASR